tara:strand:- start:462 stop:698 length:237 start_codon:yes stop_codon:yes gene_type:complete
MKLSNQAVGALMMALQRSLLEQTDIVPILRGWDVVEKSGELFVENPTVVKWDDEILDNLREKVGDDSDDSPIKNEMDL